MIYFALVRKPSKTRGTPSLLLFWIFGLAGTICAQSEYRIEEFLTGKVMPASANRVITAPAGKSITATTQTDLKKGQILLRRKFGVGEYGLFLGRMQSNAYAGLSVFRLPKDIDHASAVALKFYSSARAAKSRSTMDIRDLYFDQDFVYAENKARLSYSHQNKFHTLRALDERPAIVILRSVPPEATVYDQSGDRLGRCPVKLIRTSASSELFELGLHGHYRVSQRIAFVAEQHEEILVKLPEEYTAHIKDVTANMQFEGANALEKLEKARQTKERIAKSVGTILERIQKERASFQQRFPALPPRGEFEKTSWYEKRKMAHESQKRSAFDKAITPLEQAVARHQGILMELETAIVDLENDVSEEAFATELKTLTEHALAIEKLLGKSKDARALAENLLLDLKAASRLFAKAEKLYRKTASLHENDREKKYQLLTLWERILKAMAEMKRNCQDRINELARALHSITLPSAAVRVGKYDADLENYQIRITHRKGNFDFQYDGWVKVPISLAQSFRSNPRTLGCRLEYRKLPLLCLYRGKTVRRYIAFQTPILLYRKKEFVFQYGEFTFPSYILESPSWKDEGMSRIPAGCFGMGSAVGGTDEQPLHRVCLDAFWIDSLEVTQAQFNALMEIHPAHFKECVRCPMENVTWAEAQEYCQRTGKRLPTEAEWEYAARAGRTTRFYWGIAMDSTYAWTAMNSQGKTHPAGSLTPNAWGLHDMIGNVWEWCSDNYSSRYYAQSPVRNPKGPRQGTAKVLRGGSWDYFSRDFSSATRLWHSPDTRSFYFGFRCAR